MAVEVAAMIAGVLLVGAACLWGLNALHHDFHSSVEGYEQLRRLYEVASYAATARTLLTLTRPEENHAETETRLALETFNLYSPPTAEPKPGPPNHKEQLRASIRQELGEALHATDVPERTAALNRVLMHVSTLASVIRINIERTETAADANRRTTLIVMSAIVGVIAIMAILLGLWQYRSVMSPLNRLGQAARTIAAGQFSSRIPAQGHAELADLAQDFNRMAGELEDLYRGLELKVAAKSNELARSERLASVGFLAAGVAHEINNPIGIIAGQAELMLQQLRNNNADPDVQHTLQSICDEAFRCKEIVQNLLTLARPGEANRKRISLAAVATNVVSTISALGEYRGKHLVLQADSQYPLDILASEGEMKQVVLNLVINALEAVRPHEGQVIVHVRQSNGMVELSVSDNGRGMTPQVLEHVFEPFFTAKRGRGQRGTGLGLSISHAIVQSHGGTIIAESPGAGQGSRFIVRLPAADSGVDA